MLGATQFYPWQTQLASSWLSDKDRFAHAWLIHGNSGIGKTQFALAAGASLLCQSPNDYLACGKCQSCNWIINTNHPDIKRIRPDALALQEYGEDALSADRTADIKKPSNEIRIAQLRALNNWFNISTHESGYRVAIIYPADAMNLITANALLKILEEPPQKTIFMLVSDSIDRLLPTIISRCRRLPLPKPDVEISLKWLQENNINSPQNWLAATNNTPLNALYLAKHNQNPYPEWVDEVLTQINSRVANPDISNLVDTLSKEKNSSWLQVLLKLVFDAQLISNGLQAKCYPSLKPLNNVAIQSNSKSISNTYKWLLKQNLVSNHPLNPKLFIHNCLQQVIMSLQPTN